MIDLIAALLIVLGMRHSAPAVYRAPVMTLPAVHPLPTVLEHRNWGSECRR